MKTNMQNELNLTNITIKDVGLEDHHNQLKDINFDNPDYLKAKDDYVECVKRMILDPNFKSVYSFYGFMLNNVKIYYDEILETLGVTFYNGNYEMHINPYFFNTLTFEQKMWVLAHEVSHIANNHVVRGEQREKSSFNIACDMAINQLIPGEPIPNSIDYKDYKNFPELKTAEVYYDLLNQNQNQNNQNNQSNQNQNNQNNQSNQNQNNQNQNTQSNQNQNNQNQNSQCNQSNQNQNNQNNQSNQNQNNQNQNTQSNQNQNNQNQNQNNQNNQSNQNQNNQNNQSNQNQNNQNNQSNQSNQNSGLPKNQGSHNLWKVSSEQCQLAKTIAEKMVKKSAENCLKVCGNLPQNYEEILNLFNEKGKINWKNVLRNLLSNKKIGFRSTIKKRCRRMPDRDDLRGKTPLKTFNLIVLVDVSGSMENNVIINCIKEIKHLCKQTKVKGTMIQFDVDVQDVSIIDEKILSFKRAGSGGTDITNTINYIKDNKIQYDLMVMITDGYFNDDLLPKNTILLHNEGDKFPLKEYKNFNID